MEKTAPIVQAVSLLKTLIATPSVSRDEAAVAQVLQQHLLGVIQQMPAQARPQHFRHLHNNWLIAPGFTEWRPTLLLNAHIDTVKPSASWTYSPFEPTEVSEAGEERIYGLGANDDGASLVSLLQVFLMLCGTSQTYNLIFLASAEEEVSGHNGIESVLPLLPPIDVAWVGEPTGMQLAVAEKGLVVLDGVAHGKSGHAARNEGVNALYVALEAIDCLNHYPFAKQSAELGPIKVTTTNIQAGQGQHNVVPDTCSFIVDCRTTNAYTNQEVVEQLQAAVSHPSIQGGRVELTPRSTRLQPSGISQQHALVRRIQQVCPEVALFGSPTLSDQALLTCPSIKMGPGQSSRSHTANEYICVSEIEQAITLIYQVLNGLNLEK